MPHNRSLLALLSLASAPTAGGLTHADRRARAPLALGLASLALAATGCVASEPDAVAAEHELTVCAAGETVEGIDVSSWQGTIDWDAVAATGISFAIVRIGDGLGHDAQFTRNWSEVERVGLIRGAYQFFREDEDPAAQAAIVIDAVGLLGPGDLPVTIDVEAPSPTITPAVYADHIRTWIDMVTEGTGKAPIIYTGRYYWDPYVATSEFSDHPLWHAQYTSAACPNINDRWATWAFWQYTSSGSIAGISGDIDRDRFNGSQAALEDLAGVVDDLDGDGSPADEDCDDGNANRYPGATETCDGVDQDCDGELDDGVTRVCGTDVGACSTGAQVCTAGSWGACTGGVAALPESCNGLDDDCDGTADGDAICDREEAALGAAILALDESTDVDGDGRADACARLGGALTCRLASDAGFDAAFEGPVLVDADGWNDPLQVASLRMADLDGDGRADVCGRTAEGFACWRSTGTSIRSALPVLALDATTTQVELGDVDGDGRLDACARDGEGLHCHLATASGWGSVVTLADLSDAGGFGDVAYYGTLRLGDVDGDGRADVCARDADGVDCWTSEGTRFGARVVGPRWSDASGFDDVAYWSTVRLGDVDGDGRADLCARTPNGFLCALSQPTADSTSFDILAEGPALGGSAWASPAVYSTLRLADVDGDGALDVCARETDRVRCWLYDAMAFRDTVLGPTLSDASGWSEPTRFRSIRFADVDADGRADVCARDGEGLHCYVSDAAPFDTHWVESAWASAELDTALGVASLRLAGGDASRATTLDGSCSCAAPGASGSSRGGGAATVLAGLAALVATRRRRARR